MSRIVLFISLVSLAASHYFFFVKRALFYGSAAGIVTLTFILAYAIMVSSERMKKKNSQD